MKMKKLFVVLILGALLLGCVEKQSVAGEFPFTPPSDFQESGREEMVDGVIVSFGYVPSEHNFGYAAWLDVGYSQNQTEVPSAEEFFLQSVESDDVEEVYWHEGEVRRIGECDVNVIDAKLSTKDPYGGSPMNRTSRLYYIRYGEELLFIYAHSDEMGAGAPNYLEMFEEELEESIGEMNLTNCV
ncbi:MAG: hypothetical protein ABIG39_02680 [Candidatus Micrarchaeota archaeon]